MAWHMGHPLSQTLFTSLYIDHMYSTGTPSHSMPTFGSDGNGSDKSVWLQVLRAYCLGVLKTCWHVNNRVKSEHYYEVHPCISFPSGSTLIAVYVSLRAGLCEV